MKTRGMYKTKEKIMGNKFYSWEILSENVAVKLTDKSVFEYHGTGIPIETRMYWNVEYLAQGETHLLKLFYRGMAYQARIQMENSFRLRTRMWWSGKLTENIVNANDYPYMRFERVGIDQYNVDFISKEILESDNTLWKQQVYEVQELDDSNSEGRRKAYYCTFYERKLKNRENAIKIHGVRCKVCGMDFQEVYGELGEGFIEVHHVKPLYSLTEEAVINPETDLMPVCSNCHRMIHRKKGYVYSVEEMRKMVEEIRKRDKTSWS